MDVLPSALVAYFDNLIVGRLNPLMIAADRDARVTGWRGDSDAYGLADLAPGTDLPEVLPLLIGTLEALETPLLLEFVATPNNSVAHLHLVPLSQGFGLIFLAAKQDHDSRQARQQISHELALANEQKNRLLDELSKAQAQLELTNQQLVEAGMLKTLFMGRMSHEFRTPLASILGHANLASEAQGDIHKHLAAIQGGGEYLLALVENLLDQSRLDNDEIILQPSELSLADLALGLDALLADQAKAKGLRFEVATQGLPPRVEMDGTRLRQVLINLLGNALKFTEQGGVQLSLAWKDDRLSVKVTDTGPGIPVAMQQNIFEPFTQVMDNRSRKGAGLGLSISRSLVSRMGGELTLSSPASGGSIFAFSIAAPVPRGSASEVISPTSVEVLIVEDDEDLQALIGVYLEAAGYRIRFAEDGEAAVSAVANHHPDIVLMDMHLPKLNGPEATAIIRDQGYAGPVITLSAANETSDREASSHAGSNAYLNKPVDPQLLVTTIAGLIKTARKAGVTA